MRRVRICLTVFILGLVLSGLTAFPLVYESTFLVRVVAQIAPNTALFEWLFRVQQGLAATSRNYPFLAYGTDWLAFAHLVLAVTFVGPWRNPIRNRWVIEFGLIACACVVPLALIAGTIRGIPLYWRLGDCSFGIVGAIPLWLAIKEVNRLESQNAAV